MHVQRAPSASVCPRIARAGQGRAGQGRAGQGRAGQGRAGQGRAGQGRAGQGRAGQGRGQLPPPPCPRGSGAPVINSMLLMYGYRVCFNIHMFIYSTLKFK